MLCLCFVGVVLHIVLCGETCTCCLIFPLACALGDYTSGMEMQFSWPDVLLGLQTWSVILLCLLVSVFTMWWFIGKGFWGSCLLVLFMLVVVSWQLYEWFPLLCCCGISCFQLRGSALEISFHKFSFRNWILSSWLSS